MSSRQNAIPLVAAMLMAIVALAAMAGCKEPTKEKPKEQAKPDNKDKTPGVSNVPAPGSPGGGIAVPRVELTKPPEVVPPPSDPPKPKPGPEAEDATDPNVKDLLPKSGQAGAWLRKEKVTYYPAADLGKMVDNLAGYQAYGVDWAADTKYQLGDDTSNLLVVQVFHCKDAKGAYGLMTVRSDQPADEKFGADTEARGGEAAQLHICKGSVLLSLWADSSKPQSAGYRKSMGTMAGSILGKLPAVPAGTSARPDLIALLPTRGLVDARTRWYRGGNWLGEQYPDLGGVGRLDNDDELATVEYQVGPDQEAVRMFLARYSSTDKAKDAYDRLTGVQSDAKTPFAVALLVGGIKGEYVYGSLTGQQYGLMERAAGNDVADLPVFPTLKNRLPLP